MFFMPSLSSPASSSKQAKIKKLQGVEFNQKKEFDDFLANFSAE